MDKSESFGWHTTEDYQKIAFGNSEISGRVLTDRVCPQISSDCDNIEKNFYSLSKLYRYTNRMMIETFDVDACLKRVNTICASPMNVLGVEQQFVGMNQIKLDGQLGLGYIVDQTVEKEH